MAVAGSPARAAPWRTRSTTRVVRSGAKGSARARTEAARVEAVITGVRPYRSESALAGSRPRASPRVAAEAVQLAWPGVRSRSAERTGSRPWVE